MVATKIRGAKATKPLMMMKHPKTLLKALALCLCLSACGASSPQETSANEEPALQVEVAESLATADIDSKNYTIFINSLKEYPPRTSIADMLNNPGNYVSIVLAYDETPDAFIHPTTPEGAATVDIHSFGYVEEDGFIFTLGKMETHRGQQLEHLLVFDTTGKMLVSDFLISGGGMEGGSYIINKVLPDGTLEVQQEMMDADTGDVTVMARTKYRFDKNLKTFKEIN
jgi:hypothetical protein